MVFAGIRGPDSFGHLESKFMREKLWVFRGRVRLKQMVIMRIIRVDESAVQHGQDRQGLRVHTSGITVRSQYLSTISIYSTTASLTSATR